MENIENHNVSRKLTFRASEARKFRKMSMLPRSVSKQYDSYSVSLKSNTARRDIYDQLAMEPFDYLGLANQIFSHNYQMLTTKVVDN